MPKRTRHTSRKRTPYDGAYPPRHATASGRRREWLPPDLGIEWSPGLREALGLGRL